VEILVVLAIIGLVAVFALPRVDYARYRIDGTMRGVATSLLGAQRAAVTRQHDIIVLLDATNQTIRIHDDANDNHVLDAGERVRAIPLGDAVVLGQGPAPPHSGVGPGPVTFTKQVDGVPALTFHRNGAASEYGGFYLTSRRAMAGGYASDARLVVVERSTGRVTRYRYDGSGWVEAF
jgi:Tfp pilus assembly protein FimT